MATTAAIIITGTFLLAGLVKGVIGLGLPTVAVGLLTLVMAPAQAAALLVVPSLVTNLWQLLAGPRFTGLLRRLWGMMVGILAGTAAGGGWLTGDASGRATALLGVALIVYAAVGLAAPKLHVPARIESWASPVVGAITGLISAATGVFVIPAAPYLQALALDKEDLVQALGLSFTVSTVALAAVLARDGALPVAIAGTSLLALAPALAGMALGTWLRGRVGARVFRLCFFLGLGALGLHLAARAFL